MAGRVCAPSGRSPASAPAHLSLSRAARPLAGGDRPDRPSSGWRSSTGPAAGSPVGLEPRCGRGRRPRLQRLHAGDDGALRGREVVRARRDLLRLLRDVLAARAFEVQRRPARAAPAALGGDPLGDACPGSAAVVIASIGDDQLRRRRRRAPSRARSNSVFNWLARRGLGAGRRRCRLADTIFMALTFAGVGRVYCSGCCGMRASGRRAALPRAAARGFAHTLIPIALAYLVAHYFSLFVFQEQAQFTYLLSDPLGDGVATLRHASGGIDSRVAQRQRDLVRPGRRARHRPRDGARRWPTTGRCRLRRRPRAARSQHWMLAVMVAFTCFGLYLLSRVERVRTGHSQPRSWSCPSRMPAHWYFMPLYLAPMVIVLYGAVRASRDERRQPRDKTSRGTKRAKR